MSNVGQSPAFQVSHVKVDDTRYGYLVDDIALGLTRGVDAKDTAVIFIVSSTIDRVVWLTTPALLGQSVLRYGGSRGRGTHHHILQVLIGADPEKGTAVECKLASAGVAWSLNGTKQQRASHPLWRTIYAPAEFVKRYTGSNTFPIIQCTAPQED